MQYNPDTQMTYCGRGGKECVLGDYPTLDDVRRLYGDKVCETWIAAQLSDLARFCTVRFTDTADLDRLATVVEGVYGKMKVTEFMLFLVQFKAGRYGRFYGTFDGGILTESMRTFLNEWNNAKFAHMQEKERERQRMDGERTTEGEKTMTMREWVLANPDSATPLLKEAVAKGLTSPDFSKLVKSM